MSRARWLALGSTLVGIGCKGLAGSEGADGLDASRGDPSDTGAIGDVAADATVAPSDAGTFDDREGNDATSEPSPWPSADASCPRSGSFSCGPGACDRATQFCFNGACAPLSELGVSCGHGVQSDACADCPTCACVLPGNGNPECVQDNFGGLTILCTWGPCYGSPPARVDPAVA